MSSVGSFFSYDNSSFEWAEQFRYLGTNLTDQNSVQEENKCRLKSQNACYHLVQNTIHKTVNLNVFTNYWMYPVSLFASIFPYSKQKNTYTCCLCEVHFVLKEKMLPVQATVSLQCARAHVHSNCFIAATV